MTGNLTELRAGDLTAVLDGVTLSNVRWRGAEVARQIYVAVRNVTWGTVPPVVTKMELDALTSASFQLSLTACHHEGSISFAWHGVVTGDASGSLSYSMRGSASADFEYQRIGLCVLHATDECAGQPYEAGRSDRFWTGIIPATVEPQIIEEGIPLPLIKAVSSLAIEVASGGHVHFDFEGDLFETEDQRNWTDASFKTYGSVALAESRSIRKGEEIAQSVSVQCSGAFPKKFLQVREWDAVEVRLLDSSRQKLPAVGVTWNLGSEPPTEREVELLNVLGPAHLRVPLLAQSASWAATLSNAANVAAAVGSTLELAWFCEISDADEIALMGRALLEVGPELAPIVLVVHREGRSESATESTSADLCKLVRRYLPEKTLLVGGTYMDFAELNRRRPDLTAIDALCWGMNPQVHTTDDRSVMQSPTGQADTVRTAASFAPGVPCFVGPITLRPPSALLRNSLDGVLFKEVAPADSRQRATFAGAWTLASIAGLTKSGTESLTFFNAFGLDGLLEREVLTIVSEEGPSRSLAMFPAGHVIADVGEMQGESVVEVSVSDPTRLAVLALEDRVLLANLSARSIEVRFIAPKVVLGGVRILDDESAPFAAENPVRFRESRGQLFTGDSRLILKPYAICRIDVTGRRPYR